MYVRGVESGVCGFYTTVYTEQSYSCYSSQRCQRCEILYSDIWPLTPPGGKAI